MSYEGVWDGLTSTAGDGDLHPSQVRKKLGQAEAYHQEVLTANVVALRDQLRKVEVEIEGMRSRLSAQAALIDLVVAALRSALSQCAGSR